MLKKISITWFLSLAAIVTLMVGCNNGDTDPETNGDNPPTAAAHITITSDFVDKDSGNIDKKYTCNGNEATSPEIGWEITPSTLEYDNIVIILDDITKNYLYDNSKKDKKDKKDFRFAHWSVFNLDKTTRNLKSNASINKKGILKDKQGTNYKSTSKGKKNGYMGPCPPFVGDTHKYKLSVYALNNKASFEKKEIEHKSSTPSNNKGGNSPEGWLHEDFETKYKEQIVARGSITGSYKKK